MVVNELKKIVRSKFLWFMLILLTLIDGYNIYHMYSQENLEIEGHKEIYSQIKGVINKQKISFVIDNYKKSIERYEAGDYDVNGEDADTDTYTGHVVGDKNEFEEFYNEMKYAYEYTGDISALCDSAKTNMDFFQNVQNGYEYKKNKQINNIYEGRKIVNYYEMESEQKYIEYDFSCGLMLIMLLLIVPECIMLERQTKMDDLLSISAIGMRKIMKSKIRTIVGINLFVAIYFSIMDLIFFQSIYGLDGLAQPLYSMQEYKYCVLDVSILGFSIVNILVRFVSCTFLSFLLILLAFIFKTGIKIAVVGFSIIGILIYMCVETNMIQNPIRLLKYCDLIKEFHTICILGYPVLDYQVTLVGMIIGSVILGMMLTIWAKHCFERKA